MTDRFNSSLKRILVDKTNARIVTICGVAGFVVVFCLVASSSLLTQARYQARLITAKKTALTQLRNNVGAANNLATAYTAFVSTPQNIIGGNSSGSGAQDGDNAKIVLDALPSKYDFPALATSLEKILTAENLRIQGITGTDDEVAQSAKQSASRPEAVAIPFDISVTGNYASIQKLIATFESSTRPFQIQKLTLSGNESNMTFSLTAQTYYQPEKVFSIGSKVVK